MLHELLLSLSGHPSPLLRADGQIDESLGELIAPSEKALLHKLASLGSLHNEVRSRAAAISASDPSFVSKAIAASIIDTQLGRYQNKIIEVEKGILKSDSKLVAAYNNVPLSTIVIEFDEWPQILEWLNELLDFMQARDVSGSDSATHKYGARVLDHLRAKMRTGYSHLESICLELIKAGEAAWVRQLSSWLLYGKPPPYGSEDFFIQVKPGQSDSFIANHDLGPAFVSTVTRDSILFVGRSIHNMNALASSQSSSAHFQVKPDMRTFLGQSINLLASLESPISHANLTRIVDAIRLSLARTTLQKLLPTTSVMQALRVLHEFLLLQRGEFAMALVLTSDQHLATRTLKHGTGNTTRNPQGVEGAMIKEAELSAILSKAWAALIVMQGQGNDIVEDMEDEVLDLARDMISLEIDRPKTRPVTDEGSTTENLFADLLIGTPATFKLDIPSPLDLFLSNEHVQMYSQANSLLLGIRRAHMHLAGLWRLSVLRRVYPGPVRPVNAATQPKLAMDRERARLRNDTMRGSWAAVTSTSLFLVELGEYFQGEVVASSWSTLQKWIAAELHDPETLLIGHHRYLVSLSKSLLLHDQPFTRSLRHLLGLIDHTVGLFNRLQTVLQTLMAGESVETSGPEHLKQEEQTIAKALRESRSTLGEALSTILRRLKEIETAQLETSLGSLTVEVGSETLQSRSSRSTFSPWGNAGLSQLTMKLEFARARDNLTGLAG